MLALSAGICKQSYQKPVVTVATGENAIAKWALEEGLRVEDRWCSARRSGACSCCCTCGVMPWRARGDW